MKLVLFIITILAVATGCAPHSLHFGPPIEKDVIDRNVTESPIVRHFKNKRYDKQREASDIELHFKQFDFLNSPIATENWELYYVLGEGSKPEWKYGKIAEVTVYVSTVDDEVILDLFRRSASEIGGSGVIDMYRKPLSLPDTAQYYYGSRISPVYAYVYYGLVVREKTPRGTVNEK